MTFKLNSTYCFFALFCTVYFMEAIGGFYMISAVQSIEKQFKIPSRVSGLMVSAGDFGYIPTVAIISYLGSRGNRARWIGGGSLLIALSNFLVSSPNFLFAVQKPVLNTSVVEEQLARRPLELNNQTFEKLLNAIPDEMAKDRLQTLHEQGDWRDDEKQFFSDLFSEKCAQKFEDMAGMCDMLADLRKSGKLSAQSKEEEISKAKLIAAAPFAICSNVFNTLRQSITELKCRVDPANTGPIVVIFVALLFLGVGRTMPWSLGVPLVDDNVKRNNLPIYFAGMFFVRILGPILGLVIGSFCNQLYFTLDTPKGLSPRDPTWIGAWWLGFLGISIGMFGPSLGLFCFPDPSKRRKRRNESQADLPEGEELIALDSNGSPVANGGDSKEVVKGKERKRSLALVDRHAEQRKLERLRRRQENGTDQHTGCLNELWHMFNDFLKSISSVLKTPVYVGGLVGRIIEVMAFKGFFLFLPKYAENQFGLPHHVVLILIAVAGAFGFALGVVVGSLIMRGFKLEGRAAALFVLICSALAAGLSCFKAGVGCNSVLSTVAIAGNATNYNYNTACNSDCLCDGVPLFPVCDRSGQVYYSPCHAGCTFLNVTAELDFDTTFGDCKCANSDQVSRDFCPEDCSTAWKVYFLLFCVGGIVGGMGTIPGILLILRAVPPEHRSIALGFSGFLVSLLATLPSPVIWGAIVDRACLIWERTCDGGTGSCVIYEAVKLRLGMHLVYGGLRALAVITDVWTWYWAKGLKLMTSDDDDVTGNEQTAKRDTLEEDAVIAATTVHGEGMAPLEKSVG